MRLITAFFSITFIFSTSLFAQTTIASDEILLKGRYFELKRSEITKFLEDAYNQPVDDVSLRFGVATLFSPVIDPANYWRTVEFKMKLHGVTYTIACLFNVSEGQGTLRTTKCSSSPDAIVSDVSPKHLKDYTKFRGFIAK